MAHSSHLQVSNLVTRRKASMQHSCHHVSWLGLLWTSPICPKTFAAEPKPVLVCLNDTSRELLLNTLKVAGLGGSPNVSLILKLAFLCWPVVVGLGLWPEGSSQAGTEVGEGSSPFLSAGSCCVDHWLPGNPCVLCYQKHLWQQNLNPTVGFLPSIKPASIWPSAMVKPLPLFF